MPNINMDNVSPTVLKHALNLTPVKLAWLSHGQSKFFYLAYKNHFSSYMTSNVEKEYTPAKSFSISIYVFGYVINFH